MRASLTLASLETGSSSEGWAHTAVNRRQPISDVGMHFAPLSTMVPWTPVSAMVQPVS